MSSLTSPPRGSSPRAAEALLSAERLGYALPDGRELLHDLTIGFGRERTGLVGRNGVGKTTLVRLLVGELAPTEGTVVRAARIGFLPQLRIAAASAGGTVADALGVSPVLGALARIEAGSVDPDDFDRVGDRWNLPERVQAELARFGLGHLTLDRAMDTLSGGEATRIALAALVLDDARMLILDEPTNDLDAESRASLHAFVEGWDGGMIVISHDRALLSRVDRIVELGPKGARVYGGNFELYEERRALEEDAARRELEHARADLRRVRREAQETRERQQRRASQGAKRAAVSSEPKIWLSRQKERSQTTTAKLDRVGERVVSDGRERLQAAKERVEEYDRLALALPPSGLHAGKIVLEVTDVVHQHAPGARPIGPVTFAIRGPDRAALTGRNGAGKTTLLRLVVGDLAPTAGSVRVGVPRERVAYLDQHAAGLDRSLTVLESFRRARPSFDEGAARQVLAWNLFRGDVAHAPVAGLSGGERLRLALACALHAELPPQLLLLDEPTNHLDLDSLSAVEAALRAYDGALLVVSHDATFLERIGVQRTIPLDHR